MIYQVTAILFFDIEDEANDFYHDCQVALPKATVVKPGLEDQQCSEIALIDCHHDLTPPEPCTFISHEDNCLLLP